MTEESLQQTINGCIRHRRQSQKLLYKEFYGFAMEICLRYTSNSEEATRVMNRGFLRVFNRIKAYKRMHSAKAWVKQSMLKAALNHNLANVEAPAPEPINPAGIIDSPLSYGEALGMLNQLPQDHRSVFNMYVVDGYHEDEVDNMVGLKHGSSKPILHEARQKLTAMMLIPEPNGLVLNTDGISYTDENKPDQLLKNALTASTPIIYADKDWVSMKKLLEAYKKPVGLTSRLPLIAYAAAILLVICGWWALKANDVVKDSPVVTKLIQQPKASVTDSNQTNNVIIANNNSSTSSSVIVAKAEIKLHYHHSRRHYRNHLLAKKSSVKPNKQSELATAVQLPALPAMALTDSLTSKLKDADSLGKTQTTSSKTDTTLSQTPVTDTTNKAVATKDSAVDSVKKDKPIMPARAYHFKKQTDKKIYNSVGGIHHTVNTSLLVVKPARSAYSYIKTKALSGNLLKGLLFLKINYLPTGPPPVATPGVVQVKAYAGSFPYVRMYDIQMMLQWLQPVSDHSLLIDHKYPDYCDGCVCYNHSILNILEARDTN